MKVNFNSLFIIVIMIATSVIKIQSTPSPSTQTIVSTKTGTQQPIPSSTSSPVPRISDIPIRNVTSTEIARNTGYGRTTIDNALLISILSLMISAITLYVAHLRGPNISIAMPNNVYPCHGIDSVTLREPPKDESLGHWVIISRLLIANTGIGSGILYSLRIDPHDSLVHYYELKPHPDIELPKTLLAGEGWHTTLSIQLQSKDKSWMETLANKPTVNLRVTYLVSASFGRKVTKVQTLNIDLKPLYASIMGAQT